MIRYEIRQLDTFDITAYEKCDPIRIRRIRSMTNEKARRESIAAGLLLHEMICTYLELDPVSTPAFAIEYTENGKPYLPPAEEYPLWFSISHSGDYVCCVIGDRPVGVDLQKIASEKSGIEEKDIARLMRLAKRFFREEEYRALLQCEENGLDAAGAFARLWTIKEAYIKMLGRRITDGLDTFEIEPHPAAREGIEIAKKAGCGNPGDARENVQEIVCRSGVIREEGSIRGFYEEIQDEYLPEGYYMTICNVL